MTKWSAPALRSRGKCTGALLVACLLAWVPAARGLDATAIEGGHGSVTPGQILTIGWLLANADEHHVRLVESFSQPKGWNVSPFEGPTGGEIELSPHASSLRLAAVMIPANSPAGDYVIGCTWREAGSVDSQALQTSRWRVTVQRRDALELTARTGKGVAIAGEPCVVTLSAANRGNSLLVIKPAVRASLPWTVTLTPAEVRIAPGAVVPIIARFTPPPDLNRNVTLALDFSVESGAASATATVVTEAFPTRSADGAPGWPAFLETNWISQRQGGRPQIALGGVADSDTGRLTYLLRSVGVKQGGFFSESEQYSVSYQGKEFSWMAGHQAYGLSPLTTRAQFGSGAAFMVNGPGGHWLGSTFVMRSREHALMTGAAGAGLTYAATPDLALTFNALGREESHLQVAGGGHSGTLSLEGKYTASDDFLARLEVGGSPLRPAGVTGSPLAGRIEVSGPPDATLYRVTAENYGGGFFGALRDARLMTGNVTRTIAPTVDLRGEIQLRSYSNPYALADQQLATNRESSTLAGVTWRESRELQLTLDALRTDRSFGFSTMPTRYVEDTARLGARRTFQTWVLETSVEAGKLDAREGTVRQSSILRTNSSVSWLPTARQQISLFVAAGNDPYSSVSANTRTIGTSMNLALTSQLTATVQAGENLYDSKEARRRSYGFGEVAYQLSRGQKLGVKASWFQHTSASGGGLALAFSYSRPLELPLPSLSHRSSVSGVLTDTSTGHPLRHVIVTLNGRAAVTDDRGRYAFTQLKPGAYQLAVDPRSLGAGRLMQGKLPLAVDVCAGEATRIALSAESSGRVLVRLKRDPVAGEDAANVTGMVVQLRRAGDGAVLTELTDEQGCATFTTVRAGTWKPEMDAKQLSGRYNIHFARPTLEVAAADTQEVEVALKYEAAAIRWVSTN